MEFYDIKQKYDKMTAEVETYLTILLEDENFKEVENNLVWLLEHQGVTDEQRLNYAARIHQIDPFYNPYTKLEKTFGIMCNIQGMKRPYGDDMEVIANKLIEFLER